MANRIIVIDIETNSIENVNMIWCVVCLDIKTNVFSVFTDKESLKEYIDYEDIFVAHNGIEFDFPILNKLWDTKIKLKNVQDTLVMSRLFKPNREGGHGLHNWGKLFGFNKLEHSDFSKFSEEMLTYCKRDVALTAKLYQYLLEEGKDFSKSSIILEHKIAHIIYKQRIYGFYLDRSKAVKLFSETKRNARLIEEEIKKYFKPRPKLLKEITPKYNKDGKLSKVNLKGMSNPDVVCGPFSKFEYRKFNLASPKQIVERLNECGWRPKVFTPKGAPKICEENLATVPDNAPESAKKLSEWKMLETRWKTVEAWLENLDQNDRVHGSVYTMGAITGRMTHSNPNMANVVSVDKPYGKECRECWSVPTEQYRIVGMDAKGLELRMLAHYMRDEEYIDVVLNGDPHTTNMKAAGLSTRAESKRFIYAFLYGAGVDKLGSVVGGTAKEGARLKREFLKNMPALDNLIKKVQKMAEKGSIQGLDGRRIYIRHQHAALNTLLQGAGAISCKQWSICMDEYIKKHRLRANLVNTIHDEMQYEVHKNDVDMMLKGADLTMQEAGSILRVRLPLNADAKVGRNWAETH